VKNDTGSQGWGIYISKGSTLNLYPASPNTVAIQNNTVGISLWDGSVYGYGAEVSGYGSIAITGNTNKDITASFGSKSSLTTGSYRSYGTCTMDTSSMGLVCP
jgi:hypothetical protein